MLYTLAVVLLILWLLGPGQFIYAGRVHPCPSGGGHRSRSAPDHPGTSAGVTAHRTMCLLSIHGECHV